MTSLHSTAAAEDIDSAALGWGLAQDVWTLRLGPAWDGTAYDDAALPPAMAAGGCVRIDGHALQRWDASLAAALWALHGRLRQRGLQVELSGLPAGLGELLALAQAGEAAREPAAAARPVPGHALHEARLTITFFGEVLIALARWLGGAARVRGSDVLQQLDQTGPRSAPIVLLSCALVGVMLAYMGGARWAEPLRDAVPRLLRQDLEREFGTPLWTAPLPPGVRPTRQLRIEVTVLDVTADQRGVALAARWSLADAQGGSTPAVFDARFDTPASDSDADALVLAHRQALTQLARRIADSARAP